GENVEMDLGDLISQFQAGLEEQLDRDPQGHYDLAMSYWDMGLHDQALGEFQIAGQDLGFRLRSAEMIGRCLVERGDLDDAVDRFRYALTLPELDPAGRLDILYRLGATLEAAGRTEEALGEFERIYSADPSFPDAAA